MDFYIDHNIQAILLSIGCGSIIGLEREYRNKSAGLRTVILISFGATLFTLISRLGNYSDDRIAANIVTGIGFLGAGVIFQGKFSVQGLTTAAVIWTMAAIGMLIGFGEYAIGLIATMLMAIVLSLFQTIEDLLSIVYYSRIIHITFVDTSVSRLYDFEKFVEEHRIKATRKGLEKVGDKLSVAYEVSGNRSKMRAMNEHIIGLNYVHSFSNLN